MKSLIIHFSMTGYTRKVGERIRDGIIKMTGQCDTQPLAEVDASSLGEYDLVGLGCPVYFYKEPFNVTDFIEGLPDLKDKHWFVFCTHGSVMGNTLVSMSDRLQKKGILVMGHHHTYADATAPFFPYPVPTSGHPDELEYEQAQAFGEEVAQRSQRLTQGESGLIPPLEPVPEEWVQAAQLINPAVISQMMPALRINMELCTLCSECMDYCPAKGIDVQADPPSIQNPCIHCYQCVMICPEYAIEADWESSTDPVAAAEILARYIGELKKAEARGEFRWHVDPDSIDISNPQYKQRERKLKGKK